MPHDQSTTQLREWFYQTCLVEVLSRKPGNVSPDHAFDNGTVEDFIHSAQVSAPIVAQVCPRTVGHTIYQATEATHNGVGHNTNLGLLLLLTPMAAVPPSVSLIEGIQAVLAGLTVQDADWTYRAIRLAEPGGLGQSKIQNVYETPTETLLQCMCHAAERDLIALQYANGFRDVMNVGLEWLTESINHADEQHRIGWVALQLMAEYGDSLIARKVGQQVSDYVRQRAADVLAAGWPKKSGAIPLYTEFDAYLRSNGNRLNPGTTADMIAAIIFAGLRSGVYTIDFPLFSQIATQEPL